MLPKDLTRDVTKRLNSIKGQVKGLSKMLEEDQDLEQILNQFKAVRESLDQVHYQLLDEVYRKALAIKNVEANEACPGNCGREEEIQSIRKQFPKLQLDELTGQMNEIEQIAEALKKKGEGTKETGMKHR